MLAFYTSANKKCSSLYFQYASYKHVCVWQLVKANMDLFNEEREVHLNLYGNMSTETLNKKAREGVRTATLIHS